MKGSCGDRYSDRALCSMKCGTYITDVHKIDPVKRACELQYRRVAVVVSGLSTTRRLFSPRPLRNVSYTAAVQVMSQTLTSPQCL